MNIGTFKFGLSHKLSDRDTFATTISKNFAKDSNVGIELGMVS